MLPCCKVGDPVRRLNVSVKFCSDAPGFHPGVVLGIKERRIPKARRPVIEEPKRLEKKITSRRRVQQYRSSWLLSWEVTVTQVRRTCFHNVTLSLSVHASLTIYDIMS